MLLSDELISQLVKVTNDQRPDKGNVVVYGTIKDDGVRKYVQIDGSTESTPVETAVEISAGDRVTVSIRNHTATVTGNMTDPSIGTKTADGLRSSITQTAEEIRLELADTKNGLESSITQNASSITALVKNQDIFSEFKQTVEGFSFMGSGGSVKISGGDINLTGSISFSDFNTALSMQFDALVDTADSAYEKSNKALNKANDVEDALAILEEEVADLDLPSYLKSTYISKTTIMSPTIVAGKLYAVENGGYAEMASDGMYIYSDGATNPKVELSYDNSGGSGTVQMVLGVGSSNESAYCNRLYVEKSSTSAGIYYYNEDGKRTGFKFSLNGGITVYRAGETETL